MTTNLSEGFGLFHFKKTNSFAITSRCSLYETKTWLLLDERDARKIEKSLGLRMTGIIGILLRTMKDHKLSSIEPVIDELITQCGFRISDNLKAKILPESNKLKTKKELK